MQEERGTVAFAELEVCEHVGPCNGCFSGMHAPSPATVRAMPRCHYVVTVEVEPSRQEEWNVWHTEHHIRDMLQLPGFIAATKFKDEESAQDGWARYITDYVIDSREALEAYLRSPDRDRLRGDHAAHYGKVTRLSRQTWLEIESFGLSTPRP